MKKLEAILNLEALPAVAKVSINDNYAKEIDGKLLFVSDEEVIPYDGSADGGRGSTDAASVFVAEFEFKFRYKEKYYQGLICEVFERGEYIQALEDEDEMPQWVAQKEGNE